MQRRRADIRHYLDEDTPFPKDRLTLDVPYGLGPAYRELFDDVLAYAREQVRDGVTGTRGRVRWWSVLALLRALASSPPAAAATLRTRAANADAADAPEADALGRAAVLDSGDDESLEGIDTTPGALIDQPDGPESAAGGAERRRLLAFARRAAELAGPEQDRKLAVLIGQVKQLLTDGYDPIVFCRFIDTAGYVADHLTTALSNPKRPVHVAAVTGALPPAERERRIAALTDLDGRHVLVATDCLSEGVNLQEHFSAVVHHDLAWNPTRHEQREGRADRYLQHKDVVRALTLYGEDNGIDGIVLDVLIRKHRAIAKATGVAVPVPGDGQGLIDALAEGLLLRGQDAQQLTLDLGLDERAQALDRAWTSAAEQEKASRTRYAQNSIKPEEVAAEVEEIRAALGGHGDLEHLPDRHAARPRLYRHSRRGRGFTPCSPPCPSGCVPACPSALRDPLSLQNEPPAGRGEAVIARTDPTVQAIARYVLESALDPAVPARERPARRAGVMRTRDVSTRTTLLLVRFRFQLGLPTADGVQQRIAEDARVLAFEGAPHSAAWLSDARAEELLAAVPSGNVVEGVAHDAIGKILDGLPALMPALEAVADEHADRLLGAHRRARTGAGAVRRGLTVTAQRPVDVLSVQLLLPDLAGAA